MRVLGVLVVAGGLATGGCSGGPDERVESTPATTVAPPASPAPSVAPQVPPAGRSVLPALSVDDVAAGTKVDLSSLAPADRPLLVWFWAPH